MSSYNWEVERVNCSHEALVKQVDILTRRLDIMTFEQWATILSEKAERAVDSVHQLKESVEALRKELVQSNERKDNV